MLSVVAIVTPATRAAYFWDGTNVNVAGNGDGVSAGGDGKWSTGISNWDNGATAHVVWTTGNVANFGGNAGTVALNSAINASAVNVATAGYVFTTAAATALTLGTGGLVTTHSTGTTTINGTGASFSLGGPQTWSVGTGGTLAVNANLDNGGNTLTLAGDKVMIAGGITGAGGISSGAIATLSGSNGFTGAIGVTAGTLSVGASGTSAGTTAALGAPASISVSNGATLAYNPAANSNPTIAAPITLSGNGAAGQRGAFQQTSGGIATLDFTGGITLSADTTYGAYGSTQVANFKSKITGTGGLAFNVGGPNASNSFFVNFSSVNDYAGDTTFVSGTQTKGNYTLGIDDALPKTTNLTLNASAGLLKVDMNGKSQTLAGLVTAGTAANASVVSTDTTKTAVLTVNNAGTNAFAGVLGGSGGNFFALVKDNAGTLTLSATNSYTGGTTVKGGTLALTGTTDVGTGTVAVTAGQLGLGNGTANGNAALATGNGVTLASGTTLAFVQTNASSLSYNAFQINMNGNASLNFDGGGAHTSNVTSAVVLNNASGTQAATIGETDAGDTVNLQGVVSGTGDLKIAPGGTGQAFTVTLNKAAGYVGNTFVTQTAAGDSPVLKLLAGGTLPSSTALSLTAGATAGRTAAFDLNGQTQTLAGLTAAGTVGSDRVINSANVATAALTITNTAADTYAGGLGSTTAGTSNLSLTKRGAGLLVLSGDNTYTGGTTVTAGTLRVDAAIGSATGSGAVVVNTGGTLAGTGTIGNGDNDVLIGGTGVATAGGTITAGSGATAADTAGLLATGDETWNGGTNGGRYVVKFDAASGTSGVDWDRLAMASLTLSASASSKFAIGLVEASAKPLDFGSASFEIASIDKGGAGSFDVSKLSLVIPAGFGDPGDTFALASRTDAAGNVGLFLEANGGVTAAPEPGVALLVGVGGASLVRRSRRSRELV